MPLPALWVRSLITNHYTLITKQMEHGESNLTIGTLLLAGFATVIKSAHEVVAYASWLHYALATAQGLCYLASAGVGAITIYKFLKKYKNGH